jgi:hypothetical protein
MTNFQLVIDTLLALALMEAIVKPITVRATKKALEWVDAHVYVIPNWLYDSKS